MVSSVLHLRRMHFALVPGECPKVSARGPEVSTPIQYTTAQTLRKLLKRTLVKKSGAVPGPEGESGGQYTDSVHNRTRYVLGVDIDNSVYNRN